MDEVAMRVIVSGFVGVSTSAAVSPSFSLRHTVLS